MMTVRDIATRLRCGLSSVYQMVESGKLQSFRVGPSGGSIRISEEQLQAYLDSCRSEETPEPATIRVASPRAALKHLRL